jgi:hypothetical protein
MPPADRQGEHVPKELLDPAVADVAAGLQPAHQGREVRPQKPRAADRRRQRRQDDAAGRRDVPAGPMLGDQVRLLDQFHLLQHVPGVQRPKPASANLFGRQLIETRLINLVGTERRTPVPRMTGLAADLILLAASGRVLRRRDDVAGGRLGGIGGVLLQAGDLVAKLQVVQVKLLVLTPQRGHLGLKRFQPRQQRLDA